jgi:NitT/TauT family transport system permease protein
MNKIKSISLTFSALIFWMLIWQGAAIAVANPLILPTPIETASRLLELIKLSEFWRFTALSFLRIFIGILAAIPAAFIFASLCTKFEIANSLFSPALTLMKSTPVVSFILIAIFIVSREIIPSLIAFMMVFPVLYGNLREGILQASRELLEMARIFRISLPHKIRRIYLPAIKPFFFSAICTSVGLAIKAGIAAEVVAYIPDSIGKKLSDAKSYMEPADLLAWTAVIIIFSLIAEKILRSVITISERRRHRASDR